MHFRFLTFLFFIYTFDFFNPLIGFSLHHMYSVLSFSLEFIEDRKCFYYYYYYFVQIQVTGLPGS